jgi:epoxyqueuosine reductase
VSPREISEIAAQCGFELAGVAAALPHPDAGRYHDWFSQGLAGRMSYLTDHRAAIRADPRLLLPSARSIVCVGKLYNGPEPYSTRFDRSDLAWISRYAWGDDYHDVLRAGLERLAARLGPDHEWRACVDTAPLLERSYARQAGLGWIGKNTCLINEPLGSWFFLGELLTSLELEPDSPPPDRCGTCTRCIDACPTNALTPYELDATRCISYLTIELRGPIPEEHRRGVGRHVFGCDICQDVCPWNGRAPVTPDASFAPREFAPPLEKLACLSETEFREMFRGSPVKRTKYSGFLRNVALAIGNSGDPTLHPLLEHLAASEDEVVREAARSALG